MPAYFVTGTNTGAGKTSLGLCLLAAARLRGMKTLGYKPIESGCDEQDGELVPTDATALARAAGHEPAIRYRYRAPASPSVAARREGPAIERELVLQGLREHLEALDIRAWPRDAKRSSLSASHGTDAAPKFLDETSPDTEEETETDHLVLVEGAGGLLVPLGPTLTTLDLAAALGYPLLIAAANELGVINHSLLTLHAARSRGLDLAALVLVDTQPTSSSSELANAEEIQHHGQVPVLHLPYAQELGSQAAALGAPLLDALLADAEA